MKEKINNQSLYDIYVKRFFDELSEELEKEFPKGECEERGRALVLNASANIIFRKLLLELEQAVREETIKEERKRILEGIDEFSHCKKWELDETTDFYLDASIEQIKELITPL